MTVLALTQLIKNALERSFRAVWVEGEISNMKYQSSGHGYFTMKDSASQIPCAMFAANLSRLSFRLQDGMKVRVCGDVSVYAPRGAYQLIVRHLEKVGEGDLMAKFEELKSRLKAEGLFDPARKRPLPLLPGCLGIVTSPTGAAIRDMLNVTRRRMANMRIILAPAKVQGEGAAQEIVDAINALNSLRGAERPDVLIVGRGGGSIEDLWCFNEEIVARAIAASGIPVISAVGHEIDFTIADFSADLRAPTPSAAAELVTGRKDQLMEALGAHHASMRKALVNSIRLRKSRLAQIVSHRVFSQPGAIARDHAQRVDLLEERMKNALTSAAANAKRTLSDAALTIRHSMDSAIRDSRHSMDALSKQIDALSPYAVLRRGYSVTTDARGAVIRSDSDVTPGETIFTRVQGGKIASVVSGEATDAPAAQKKGTRANRAKRDAAQSIGAGNAPQQGTLF